MNEIVMSVNEDTKSTATAVASYPGVDVDELRKVAKELLESGDVKAVIGYTDGYSPDKAQPVFITDPSQTDQLIFDSRCVSNLTLYLKKAEIKAMGKVAIVW